MSKCPQGRLVFPEPDQMSFECQHRIIQHVRLFADCDYLWVNAGLGAGHESWFLRGLLASRPLRYMGQISYTFYLYQVAVMDKLTQHLRSRPEVVILAFGITFLFSAFSWQFFESQVLKLRLHQPAQNLKTGIA